MQNQSILLTMFQYNHDINHRLLSLAANVTSEQWSAPQTAGQRSLHETFFHLLSVEEEWLTLCSTGNPVWDTASIKDYPDADSLRAYCDSVYRQFLPYLENLTEDHLAASVYALMPDNVNRSFPVWHMLTHMLYHSAQHRSECAFMLTQYGQSPGAIDFYGYGLI